jgi:hypothetical protein
MKLMSDLEISRTKLYEEGLTLVIVKSGEVLFKTKSHRIGGLLDAIDQFGEKLEGSSLADRVVGKAVALLCVYGKVKAVYAEVLSRKARAVLKRNRIAVHWGELAEKVLDVNKAGVCPFEKAAEGMSEPQEAYRAFKALLDSMKSCR